MGKPDKTTNHLDLIIQDDISQLESFSLVVSGAPSALSKAINFLKAAFVLLTVFGIWGFAMYIWLSMPE